jgi:hypothetical protein
VYIPVLLKSCFIDQTASPLILYILIALNGTAQEHCECLFPWKQLLAVPLANRIRS